jgi:hypothetical protein
MQMVTNTLIEYFDWMNLITVLFKRGFSTIPIGTIRWMFLHTLTILTVCGYIQQVCLYLRLQK